ncbi:MAG: ATP-binding protein [Spirochaetales bacterium]|nr:ATP-binding protein [Spirochaetales bacterium]
MHSSIGDFLLDIIQNSLEADASAVIVTLEETDTQLTVSVADNGCGMTEKELEDAQNPFYSEAGKHDHRKAGLGIPFLAQTVSMVEGKFEIKSQKGLGTSILFSFPLDHIDTPPMGELTSVFLSAFTFSGDYEFVIHRKLSTEKGSDEYHISRTELAEALGDCSSSGAQALLRKFLISQEEALDTIR